MKINQYRQQNNNAPGPQLIGAHFSIAGGYEKAVSRAVSLKCPVFQIFTKNANSWREKQVGEREASAFCQARRKAGIVTVAAHTGYLINLASPDDRKWEKSCKAFENEVIRARQLGIELLVFHPGNHMGAGADVGIKRVGAALSRILEAVGDTGVRLLLETTAGQGTCIGHRFEHLARIMDLLDNPRRLGVCFDTCHVFAAGYDLRTAAACRQTFDDFEKIIGLSRLCLAHFNDSLKPLGARIDRHSHIGHGHIGNHGFYWLMNHPRLAEIPKIIETPKAGDGRDWDVINLEKLRAMAAKPVYPRQQSVRKRQIVRNRPKIPD